MNVLTYLNSLRPALPLSVERKGEKSNLTFSEAGLLKEVSSKKPKTERKRPEFTFYDGVGLAEDSCVHSGFLIVAMRYGDVFTDKQRLDAAREYLRNTTYFSDYSYKPLRKKIKLYIKWLQSKTDKENP